MRASQDMRRQEVERFSPDGTGAVKGCHGDGCVGLDVGWPMGAQIIVGVIVACR